MMTTAARRMLAYLFTELALNRAELRIRTRICAAAPWPMTPRVHSRNHPAAGGPGGDSPVDMAVMAFTLRAEVEKNA